MLLFHSILACLRRLLPPRHSSIYQIVRSIRHDGETIYVVRRCTYLWGWEFMQDMSRAPGLRYMRPVRRFLTATEAKIELELWRGSAQESTTKVIYQVKG